MDACCLNGSILGSEIWAFDYKDNLHNIKNKSKMMLEFFNEIVRGKFSDINKALIKPSKVKILNLQFNRNLNHYNCEFLGFKNLKELNIHTDLSHPNHLPNEIGKLKNIKKLTILNVLFEEFPMWILDLKNLKYLILRGNEITKIPDEFCTLNNLMYLRIENCELENIPKCFYQLNKLQKLSLMITKINSINEEHLPKNLKSLNLSNTKVNPEEIELLKNKRQKLKIEYF